jgi:hypothetical protein
VNNFDARRIYSSILQRGSRQVPTYSEVRRDLRTASLDQFRHFI